MYLIVYLVLTWKRKIFTYSPQKKMIVEFIKIGPVQVYIPLILNTVFSELSTAVFFCLVIVVHESLVCPEQLNCLLFLQKKPSNNLVLQHFCVFDLFPPMTMILRSIFSHWGQRRDRYATITEGSNSHRCPRRKNHALRAGVKTFEQNGGVHFS